jgi:hypothetical protein
MHVASLPFWEALLTRLYFLKRPPCGEMLVDQVVAEVAAALSASPNVEPTVLQMISIIRAIRALSWAGLPGSGLPQVVRPTYIHV